MYSMWPLVRTALVRTLADHDELFQQKTMVTNAEKVTDEYRKDWW